MTAGSEWQAIRARYLFREVVERGYDEPLASVTKDGGVEYRADLDISVWNPGGDTSLYKRVLPGDFVIGLRTFQSGIGYSKIRGLVSPAYTVLRPRSPVVDGYFRHFFKSSVFISRLENIAQGIRQGRTISTDDFYSLRLTIPPVETQRAIARYLDAETERIDALVAKKRQMSGLLAERLTSGRTAIVTGAHEDRRDTGSEWYPQLPSDWGIGSVARVTSLILDGPHVSPDYVDETGIPFLSVRNISADSWDLSTVKYIGQSDYDLFCRRVKPQLGDVLLTKGGNTGIARVVDLEFPFHVWVHVAILRLRSEMMFPQFLAACLNSHPGYEQSQLWTRGATNQDLVLGRIARMQVPIPPLRYQAGLVARLRALDHWHRESAARLEEQTELLVEHRQALVTAAVTGQIDVPGVAA